MVCYLVVEQDEDLVMVPSSRLSLISKYERNTLEITLPAEARATKQCIRSQLPGYIAAELLEIVDARAEKQIFRILDELDSGTDEILAEEGISRVSWLPETCRAAPTPPITTPGTSESVENGPDLPAGAYQTNHRQYCRPLPVEIQHEVDAPLYWKVIDHVHKQASKIGNRLHGRNDAAGNLDDLAAEFSGLMLDDTRVDPDDYPNHFGNDVWLSKFRLGAAGELFVS